MRTEDIIIRLFWMVDGKIGSVKSNEKAKLQPGEIVTIGRLFCLKGVSGRALYRWRHGDYL